MRLPERYRHYLEEPLATHEASLELVICKSGDRTCTERRHTKNQLSVSKPIYVEPDEARYILINTSGGVVQGDRLATDIRLKNGSKASVTTQSANKIYGMEQNCAIQETNIMLEDGASLVYVPEANIPYANSRFFQFNTVNVSKGSRLFFWDIVYPGRYSRGEEFDVDVYFSRLDLAIDGEPALVDTVLIDPKRQEPCSPGIMGGKRFYASVYAYAEDYGIFEETLGEYGHCVNAAGILIVRILENDALSLMRSLEEIRKKIA